MPQCALCNHSDEITIVPHIREKHDLKLYLALFPDLPIVNKPLNTAIENAVFFGYIDDTTPGMPDVTEKEREAIIVCARNNAHLRSEIIQTLDF